VGLEPDRKDVKWGADFKFSLDMLDEVGLELVLFDTPALRARQ
jgi:hypothetical protein